MQLPTPQHRSRRGVALVITLAFLVLLTVIILAFLSSVQTEVTSANTYDRTVTVKQLVDSSTQIVMGQIVDGTKSLKPGTTSRIAWASQPGMIRSWDDKGTGWKAFKLYSSADMVLDLSSGPYIPSDPANLNAEIPPAWQTEPARYTDLNAPVMVPDTTGPISRDGKKFRASYPIVDAAALDPATGVEGFSVTNAPGTSASYSPTDDPSKVGNPVPMPVAWIYVLRDGTLTVPDSGSGDTATWSGGNPPTVTNPIVGRVAFWTDDESCKINLNTASEPTPWDTPRMVGKQDLDYGKYQPAAKEFQRFPGHPFTTALSPVFYPNTPSKNLTSDQRETLYSLIPRVGTGGSTGATKAVTLDPPPSVTPDQDRLIATVDEFIFQANREPASNINAAVSPEKLRQSRFFLTANSRAPEINLFGQPRVSLWPQWDTGNIAFRTTYDKLSAFCSTLGANAYEYFFQRKDSNSPTVDANIDRNKELYSYLQYLTSQNIPAFGGNFASKWTTDGRNQILTEMFDYIRCTNLKDPQADPSTPASQRQGKVYAQYPGTSNAGQVVPIKIDQGSPTMGFGRFYTLSQFGMVFICSQDGPDKGISKSFKTDFDRAQSDAVNKNNANPPGVGNGEKAIEAAFVMEPYSVALGWTALKERIAVSVEFLTPMTINGTDLRMRSSSANMNNIVGIGQEKQGYDRGGSAGIRASVDGFTKTSTIKDSRPVYPFGSAVGFKGKPTQHNRVIVPAGGGTMNFSGGRVRVKLFAGTAATGTPIQTFELDFPGGNIPIPDLADSLNDQQVWQWWSIAERCHLVAYSGGGAALPAEPGSEYGKPSRQWQSAYAYRNTGLIDGQQGGGKGSFIHPNDVVRTIVPKSGDIRLIAAKEKVGPEEFVQVRGFAGDSADSGNSNLWSTTRFLHVFTDVAGTQYLFGHSNEPGLTVGNKIAAVDDDAQLHGDNEVKYHYSRLPEIRPGAGKLYNLWGDFDNGIAQWADGSYINKPDEGNTRDDTQQGYPYFTTGKTDSKTNFTVKDNTLIIFSPSRLAPSAGMFGSLPVGVSSEPGTMGTPWTTLLFRPDEHSDPHPGLGKPKNGPPFTTPPDYLVMDLFWNPVVEPYAISDPFSTAGKVNMNYEIVPFTFIKRSTAINAAMKAEEPLLIPNDVTSAFKVFYRQAGYGFPGEAGSNDTELNSKWAKLKDGAPPYDRLRRPINMDPVNGTLKQFEDRFASGEIFRSATQISSVHLVRDGETLSQYKNNSIWPENLATGDNTREKPYTDLYARLTTQSNVFTVHVRAQVLRQPSSRPPTEWDEKKGQVVAEFRGSTILERYIDPSDPKLKDFAVDKTAVVDDSYKIRVVSNKKFTP